MVSNSDIFLLDVGSEVGQLHYGSNIFVPKYIHNFNIFSNICTSHIFIDMYVFTPFVFSNLFTPLWHVTWFGKKKYRQLFASSIYFTNHINNKKNMVISWKLNFGSIIWPSILHMRDKYTHIHNDLRKKKREKWCCWQHPKHHNQHRYHYTREISTHIHLD